MDFASATLFALLFCVPVAVIAIVLYSAFRVFASTKRELPEDVPPDLVGGTTDKLPSQQAKAANDDFKENYRGSIRRRFATVLERMNAFFNIQKRY